MISIEITFQHLGAFCKSSKAHQISYHSIPDPSRSNTSIPFQYNWKTTGGEGGGRIGSWVARSSRNLPSPLSLGTESPCTRVRSSGSPQGACHLPLKKPGRIWEGSVPRSCLLLAMFAAVLRGRAPRHSCQALTQ